MKDKYIALPYTKFSTSTFVLPRGYKYHAPISESESVYVGKILAMFVCVAGRKKVSSVYMGKVCLLELYISVGEVTREGARVWSESVYGGFV